MGKPFFEVFPSLKLEQKVHDIMEQTTVEKVSATKKKDYLRIYIQSSRLILKEDIWHTENCIKAQLFPNMNLVVKLYEKFNLSSQYTPEKLLDMYLDSILEEVREYSNVEFNLLKNAYFLFPQEELVILSLEDSVIARSKEEELCDILLKILVERCGFSLNIQVEYRDAGASKFAEEAEIKLKQEVAEIYRRVNKDQEESTENEQKPEDAFVEVKPAKEEVVVESKEAPKQKTTPTPNIKKVYGGKGAYQKKEFKSGGDYGKSVKRSENPDVLYGRDFEEEAMRLDELVGEMGEVIIRGQIVSTDKREIKNEKTISYCP